ncbi:hypothetical protein B0H13DRAFT_1667537, partial [Mycena leptocephala]
MSSYKKKTESRSSTAATTYTFFCAQNEKEETKMRLTDDLRKRRARMKMDRFPCNGYLHVTVNPNSPEIVRLRLQHHRAHCHYVDISLPDDIKKLVEDMKDQPASNVCHPICIWTRILQDYPNTQVTQKQIYTHW